jgi:hypothetical protein
MANSYNTIPIRLDTDTASWFSGQTLQAQRFGLRVWKVMLVGGGAAPTAGSVTITEPNSGITLLSINVPTGSTANQNIYNDNPTQLLQWRDFACNGLTATGTVLYVWYRV